MFKNTAVVYYTRGTPAQLEEIQECHYLRPISPCGPLSFKRKAPFGTLPLQALCTCLFFLLEHRSSKSKGLPFCSLSGVTFSVRLLSISSAFKIVAHPSPFPCLLFILLAMVCAFLLVFVFCHSTYYLLAKNIVYNLLLMFIVCLLPPACKFCEDRNVCFAY